MKFPKVQVGQAPIKRQVIEFKGYDAQSHVEDGKMREMKNLASDEYPCLYQRKQRGLFSEKYSEPTAIMARKEKLCVIDGKRFFYDGELKGYLDTDGEKQVAAVNQKIVVFPDKKYYDIETGVFGNMAAKIVSKGAATIGKTTIKLPDTDISALAKGDAIALRGFSVMTENNTLDDADASVVIKEVDAEQNLITLESELKLNSTTAESYEEPGPITIERVVPDLDFIMESNNRLWGCKGNTIRSSKLGDPLNWNYFKEGLATNSYAVDVGTDGDFTGCAAYSAHLLFFKENYIHKIYGNKPSNYQMVTAACLGLEKNCNRSVSIINDIVYYKSREGIMAYDGDLPTLMTYNFGTIRYDNAVGGTDGLKYYVSMRNKADGLWYLFSYDIARNLWHIEDNTKVTCFAFLGNKLLFIDDDANRIYSTDCGEGEPIPADKKIEWYAVLGEYDEYLENKKIYSEIDLRIKMEENSELLVSMSIDNGEYERVRHIYTTKKRVISIPIVPRRCDKFKIKLEGHGYCKVESVVRIVKEGTML